MNSRLNGNIMEYLASKALIAHGLKPKNIYTRHKIKSLNKCQYTKETYTRMCKAIISVIPKCKKGTFVWNPDCTGSSSMKTPSTSDIKVNGCINLSIKNNNFSLKHQKANNLWMQSKMIESDKKQFIEDYAKINDMFYKRWTKKQYEYFHEVGFDEKCKWYVRVNNLTKKYLLKSKLCLDTYIHFVMDITDEQKYIVHCQKNKIDIVQQDLKVDTKCKITVQQSFLIFQYKNGSTIKMRLHSSKNKITKLLALKYDTSVLNGLKVMSSFL